MQQSVQPKYSLTEAEQRTKPYLQNLPDDPGGLSYGELLIIIEGYYQRGEVDREELAKSYAGLGSQDDIEDAVEILDELVDTEFHDAMSYVKEKTTDQSSSESAYPLDTLLDESMEFESEHAELLYQTLEAAREDDTNPSEIAAIQTDLLESLSDIALDRELKRFIKAWSQGAPLAKAPDLNETIREYCRMVFSNLPPAHALPELAAVRDHYGDETDMFGAYRIGRMIAGCHAAIGQFDEAKSELRSKAHVSFGQMRRYTDFCLAFGFCEDLIKFVQANVNGEKHMRGRYVTVQMIMAYRMLGRTDDALPHLKARVNVRIRDQHLIDNIWSLKLRTGERPEGSEVLSVQRSSLRAFGKRNIEMVSSTVDALLEVYERETGLRLLAIWSKECGSSKYVSNVHLISIPGLLNPSAVLPFVKERNFRFYVETDVRRTTFIGHNSVNAFLADITRLGEDLTKSAGKAISIEMLEDTELHRLLKIDAVRSPVSLDLEAILPDRFQAQPLKIDIGYIPPRDNISRFNELAWLIPQTYALRDTNPDAIDDTIRLCKEQIVLSYDMAHYQHLWWRFSLAQRKKNSVFYEHDPEYLEHYLDQVRFGFGLPKCLGFERLAIILEKKRKYEAALHCVVKAKSEGWPGSWDKRILRLVKKANV